MLFAGPLQVGDKGLHAVEAGFVERFEDVERGEEERAGAAGGVEDGDLLDGLPEGQEQVRAFAVLDDILRELADVEIEGDEVVDVADFAGRQLLPALPRSAAGGRRLRARFRWAGAYSPAARVLFQALRRSMQVGLGGVQAPGRFPVGQRLVQRRGGRRDRCSGRGSSRSRSQTVGPVGIFKGDLALWRGRRRTGTEGRCSC